MRPSPNFGDRRGRAIDALVLHYTGMASGEAALARLLDTGSEVSAHYLVWEDGRIDQLVAEADRAWHAGRSFWAGERDLNAISIGIEIVNGGHDFGLPPYPPGQIATLAALSGDICARRAIAPARVLGHSDVAPERKADPGERFPWDVLMRAGIAAALETDQAPGLGSAPSSIDALQRALAAIGYECPHTGLDDEVTRAALRAFQRRWRPGRVDGLPDAETAGLLRAVRAASSSPS